MFKHIARVGLVVMAGFPSAQVPAADACEASSECLQGAALIAPIEAVVKRCEVLNPAHAASLRGALSQASSSVSPALLASMRDSALYARTMTQANERLDKLGKEKLQALCDAAAKPKAALPDVVSTTG